MAGAITAAATHVLDGDLDELFTSQRRDAHRCEGGSLMDRLIADRACELLAGAAGGGVCIADVASLQEGSASAAAAATVAAALEVSRILLPTAALLGNALRQYSRRLDGEPTVIGTWDSQRDREFAAHWAQQLSSTVETARKAVDGPFTVSFGCPSDGSRPTLDMHAVSRYLTESTELPFVAPGRGAMNNRQAASTLRESTCTTASVFHQVALHVQSTMRARADREPSVRGFARNSAMSKECDAIVRVCHEVHLELHHTSSTSRHRPIGIARGGTELVAATIALSDSITAMRRGVVEPLTLGHHYPHLGGDTLVGCAQYVHRRPAAEPRR
ncbi:hypothetical protein [Rhodococcus sovatensis]|uniref:Uncharacterized protein n=1 Tax=Rhodococcus sovatensis TaxID=1805840 RepID=A0ABZ2PPL8_9NOCA